METLFQSLGKKPRKGQVIECPVCKTGFYVSAGSLDRRFYCSRECKHEGQQNKQDKTCEKCGKIYNEVVSVGSRFFSWSCYNSAREYRNNCKVCGIAINKPKHTYCSHDCRAIGKKEGLKKPCEVCGTPVSYQKSNEATTRFCSRDCKHESMRLKGPGAKFRRPDGYIWVYYPTHPDTTKGGMVLEHRLVAQEKYGRRILKTEHVHHINGIRDDNRPENLEVITASAHAPISNAEGVRKRKAIRDELEEYRKRYGAL